MRSSADLRVSDAERSAAADRLSEHFGAGRLTDAEFHERLDQAMGAKTFRDLDMLFVDLPRIARPEDHPDVRRRRGLGFPVLLLVVGCVATAFWVTAHLVVPHAHVVIWPFPGWLFVVAGLLIWRRHARRRHYWPTGGSADQ
jgi:hypothetical protein